MLHGVFNILATPFDEQGRLDEESLRCLVDFQLKAGAHGLTILGIMGEVAKLSDGEREQVTRVVLDQVNGRVPVVVNVTRAGTRVVIEAAEQAAALGAAGVMLAPPVNLRNLDGLAEFYRTVAGAISLPIVVQDEPVTTGVTMPASFIAGLGLPMVKVEEPPVPYKISRILERNSEARLFGGMGGLYFLQELERGAVGTMTGFAFTEVLVAVYRQFTEGHLEAARTTFYRHLPVISLEGQPGIGLAIRKEILKRRGAIRCAEIRSPGIRLDRQTQAEISRVLEMVGLA